MEGSKAGGVMFCIRVEEGGVQMWGNGSYKLRRVITGK